MALNQWIRRILRRPELRAPSRAVLHRGAMQHVILLDGTMSSLEPGAETNIGLIAGVLGARSARIGQLVYYEPGIQWADWRSTLDVIEGRGINRQIERVYGHLASRFRPGDSIYLLGYSRGAYAVRALAGLIDQVGLVRAELATERVIRQAYRHYRYQPGEAATRLFARSFCHPAVEIAFLGCFDTVKALGIRAPVVWRFSRVEHSFHSLQLGRSVKCARHALALNETRDAFAPVMWESADGQADSRLVQMWFPGTHGDVGGMLGGFEKARGLSNIPLRWMLGEAAAAGLMLPDGWQGRFPASPDAPTVGTLRGWGKMFVSRHRRRVLSDPSERLYAPVPVTSA